MTLSVVNHCILVPGFCNIHQCAHGFNESQREPWPENHLPAGNLSPYSESNQDFRNTTPVFYSLLNYTDLIFVWAATRNRTKISRLQIMCNSLYTIAAYYKRKTEWVKLLVFSDSEIFEVTHPWLLVICLKVNCYFEIVFPTSCISFTNALSLNILTENI